MIDRSNHSIPRRGKLCYPASFGTRRPLKPASFVAINTNPHQGKCLHAEPPASFSGRGESPPPPKMLLPVGAKTDQGLHSVQPLTTFVHRNGQTRQKGSYTYQSLFLSGPCNRGECLQPNRPPRRPWCRAAPAMRKNIRQTEARHFAREPTVGLLKGSMRGNGTVLIPKHLPYQVILISERCPFHQT